MNSNFRSSPTSQIQSTNNFDDFELNPAAAFDDDIEYVAAATENSISLEYDLAELVNLSKQLQHDYRVVQLQPPQQRSTALVAAPPQPQPPMAEEIRPSPKQSRTKATVEPATAVRKLPAKESSKCIDSSKPSTSERKFDDANVPTSRPSAYSEHRCKINSIRIVPKKHSCVQLPEPSSVYMQSHSHRPKGRSKSARVLSSQKLYDFGSIHPDLEIVPSSALFPKRVQKVERLHEEVEEEEQTQIETNLLSVITEENRSSDVDVTMNQAAKVSKVNPTWHDLLEMEKKVENVIAEQLNDIVDGEQPEEHVPDISKSPVKLQSEMVNDVDKELPIIEKVPRENKIAIQVLPQLNVKGSCRLQQLPAVTIQRTGRYSNISNNKYLEIVYNNVEMIPQDCGIIQNQDDEIANYPPSSPCVRAEEPVTNEIPQTMILEVVEESSSDQRVADEEIETELLEYSSHFENSESLASSLMAITDDEKLSVVDRAAIPKRRPVDRCRVRAFHSEQTDRSSISVHQDHYQLHQNYKHENQPRQNRKINSMLSRPESNIPEYVNYSEPNGYFNSNLSLRDANLAEYERNSGGNQNFKNIPENIPGENRTIHSKQTLSEHNIHESENHPRQQRDNNEIFGQLNRDFPQSIPIRLVNHFIDRILESSDEVNTEQRSNNNHFTFEENFELSADTPHYRPDTVLPNIHRNTEPDTKSMAINSSPITTRPTTKLIRHTAIQTGPILQNSSAQTDLEEIHRVRSAKPSSSIANRQIEIHSESFTSTAASVANQRNTQLVFDQIRNDKIASYLQRKPNTSRMSGGGDVLDTTYRPLHRELFPTVNKSVQYSNPSSCQQKCQQSSTLPTTSSTRNALPQTTQTPLLSPSQRLSQIRRQQERNNVLQRHPKMLRTIQSIYAESAANIAGNRQQHNATNTSSTTISRLQHYYDDTEIKEAAQKFLNSIRKSCETPPKNHLPMAAIYYQTDSDRGEGATPKDHRLSSISSSSVSSGRSSVGHFMSKYLRTDSGTSSIRRRRGSLSSCESMGNIDDDPATLSRSSQIDKVDESTINQSDSVQRRESTSSSIEREMKKIQIDRACQYSVDDDLVDSAVHQNDLGPKTSSANSIDDF